jgi:hypothetical protein
MFLTREIQFERDLENSTAKSGVADVAEAEIKQLGNSRGFAAAIPLSVDLQRLCLAIERHIRGFHDKMIYQTETSYQQGRFSPRKRYYPPQVQGSSREFGFFEVCDHLNESSKALATRYVR